MYSKNISETTVFKNIQVYVKDVYVYTFINNTLA